MATSMQKFTFECFHDSGSIEKIIVLTMDCIVGRGTSLMFSSFFSATFAISSNVSTSSYLTYCRTFNNNLMVKCFSTSALILTNIRIIHLWPYALRHLSNLFCNFIVFSFCFFTNFKAPCISGLN